MSAIALLESFGVHPTPTRIAVLEALSDARYPISFREIQSILPGRHDRITLNRTLSLFIEKGIAHRVQDIKGTWHLCLHPSPHPHFSCRICGKLTCMAETPLPNVQVAAGVELEGQYMVLYGVCDACGKQLAGLTSNKSLSA